jgi:hypothetical protein
MEPHAYPPRKEGQMDPRPPTLKQQRYLRLLAQRTGTTYTPPRTLEEASRTIEEIKARGHSPRGEAQRDRALVARDMVTRRGDAASVTSRELRGYGASATWVSAPQDEPERKPSTQVRTSRRRSQERSSEEGLGLG